jgi:hypothetical protein
MRLFGREPVSHPRLGDDEARAREIGFDLLAQRSVQHAQVLGLIDRMRAPDGLEDRLVGQHAAGVLREEQQEIELLGCQPNLFVALRDAAAVASWASSENRGSTFST